MKSSRVPELIGLVLAGGDSRRMGSDKGALGYRGVAQARYLWQLLGRNVKRCFVSINQDQRTLAPYSDLPAIVDPEPRQGPATGLLAAHDFEPGAAWLVAAVDLVHIDDRVVRVLIRGRQPSAAATAMRQPDGTIEPLFAIWEPSALALLMARVGMGDASPRRCLESAEVEILRCPKSKVLDSINCPSEREALLQKMDRGS